MLLLRGTTKAKGRRTLKLPQERLLLDYDWENTIHEIERDVSLNTADVLGDTPRIKRTGIPAKLIPGFVAAEITTEKMIEALSKVVTNRSLLP